MNAVLQHSELRVACRELPPFAADDPEMIWKAFQSATALRFRQAWRKTQESNFSPGAVRIGWRDDRLLVFAEMTDRDIFNDATDSNQQLWTLGDTFEIFLRPVDQRAYVELHVTPNNHRLQLRHLAAPSCRDGDAWKLVRVQGDLFFSRTWIWPEVQRWIVYAEIPASVAECPPTLAGSSWKFSFGRYDYSRGRTEPVLSSTSNHVEPDFHRQHEWGVLNCAP